MFNLAGSEIVVILLLALVVLGPEKLPEAIRRAGRTYAELKKMGNSFQSEMKSVLDEPMKEMRETADLLREAADFTDTGTASAGSRAKAAAPPAINRRNTTSVSEPTDAAGDSVHSVDHADTLDTADAVDEALINRTLSGGTEPEADENTTT